MFTSSQLLRFYFFFPTGHIHQQNHLLLDINTNAAKKNKISDLKLDNQTLRSKQLL